ncbi:GNAT family N-acetyltransferase [Piscinibacter sp. XHJ-5]|uniref:GNAT family N-acetyltransferase n=1 Tax=Piscinibacter sp. XHJ-5 TaxID=3037797 RepID=UPI002452D01F|nr:GNAT family N-acetyltransferase [Piscinibacter sp. XHJ-5]
MNIRPALANEAERLSTIALAAKGRWPYSPAQIDAWRADLTLAPESISALHVHVAEVRGEVVGFYALDHPGDELQLEHLWVHPDHVGQGIGRGLLAHALQLAAEHGASEIAIDADPHAEPFYLACGARRVGTVAAPIEGSPQRARPQLRLATRIPVFAVGTLRALEFGAADVPALQAFFDANPDYFVGATGQPAEQDEALRELNDSPPAGWSYTKKWLLGFVDDRGALAGVANVWSDFLVEGTWHIGLFIVASSLHGSGTAQALHGGLEHWMRNAGGRWIRLGVVKGRERAERFWQRMGYTEVRQRTSIAMGQRVNDLRVMAKPLGDAGLDVYLARMARDNPGAP